MANQASRATSLAPEQGPSALAAAATILMPIQASGLAATAAPAAIHNKGIYVDLTADDSESGGDVVAPTPAPTPAPAPVHYVDSDDEVVVLPPPRVREERARAGTQTGNIRLSITACKDAASMYWHLATVINYWMNEPNSDLGSFPMEPTHSGQLRDLLAPFKTVWKDTLHPFSVQTIADRLDDTSTSVRAHFQKFSIRNNTLHQLFRLDTPNEVRNVWREYTAHSINLQVGKPMLINEHFEGFFPVLYKHMVN
ncbi:hypothetical protein H4I96_12320 [Botrytis cinerea]